MSTPMLEQTSAPLRARVQLFLSVGERPAGGLRRAGVVPAQIPTESSTRTQTTGPRASPRANKVKPIHEISTKYPISLKGTRIRRMLIVNERVTDQYGHVRQPSPSNNARNSRAPSSFVSGPSHKLS